MSQHQWLLVMRLSCYMIDDIGHIANMAIASHHFTASMKYQARIFVTLRPSVLDPAGTAVQSALKQMDYHVDSVRIGKYVEIVLEAADEAAASQKLDEACDKLLANPVIENYRFELTAIAQEQKV